jgi:hypothetical protein
LLQRETRHEQLQILEAAIEQLLAVVESYPDFPYTAHFRSALVSVRELQGKEFSQTDLTSLAVSVLGPFTPKQDGIQDYIAGTWLPEKGKYDMWDSAAEYEQSRDRLYESAFCLRVVGEVE